jgi:peptidoglycan hydrolase CwlO-like protein
MGVPMWTIILIAVVAAVVFFVAVGYFIKKSSTQLGFANEDANKNELDALREQVKQTQDALREKILEETKSLQSDLAELNSEREKIQKELVALQAPRITGPGGEHQEIQPEVGTPPEIALPEPRGVSVEVQPVMATTPETALPELRSVSVEVQPVIATTPETALPELRSVSVEVQPVMATTPETALPELRSVSVEVQPVIATTPETEVTERHSELGKTQVEEIVRKEMKLTELPSEHEQTPAGVIPVQETKPAEFQGGRGQPRGQEIAPDQPVSNDLYSDPVIEARIAQLVQEKCDEIENLMGPLHDRVMKIAEQVENLEWRIDEQKENATQLNYKTEALVVTVREEVKKFNAEFDQQIEDLENIIESEKEIIRVEKVLERFTKQTTDAIDRNEQQSKSFADRIYDRIELFGGSLQAQTASMTNQINSQIGKFDELESEFDQLGSKVGQLKPDFEKLGSEFRKLGLAKFLWDRKEDIEVEARAAVWNKRLGLRVDGSDTDKKSEGPDLSRGDEQSPTHETPDLETATRTAEAGRTDQRGEEVAEKSGARINDPTRSFTALNVNSVPANFGVYALYKNGETILYGCTQSEHHSIRSCLQEHFRDEADEDRRWGITDYKREFTETAADAIARYTELLETFQRQNGGRLPRYNVRVA